MDEPKTDMWATPDGSDAYWTGRSQNDSEQGEKTQATGNINAKQYSNLKYFSPRTKFEDRFSALMAFADKDNLNTIYGIISINTGLTDRQIVWIDSVKDAIAKFEDVFIRSIRIPRKYPPPVAGEGKKRKSDSPNYGSARGNFDLACRTASTGRDPYQIEFVLYDCGSEDALKKIETFEGFAQDLKLSAHIEFSDNTGQNIRVKETKPRFSLRTLLRRT